MAFNIQVVRMAGAPARQGWIWEGSLRIVGQEDDFF
jgi:hypothetical protein